MVYNATALRTHLYSALDSVLETGVPVEIKRKGKILKIVVDEPVGRLDRLEAHSVVQGDSGDLADVHWDSSWKAELPE